MTLTEKLAKANKENRVNIPKDALEIIDASTASLVAEKLPSKALKVGDSFPEVTLSNAKGNSTNVHELLKKGPAVVSFYRGGWCPYCNIELSSLQGALPQFKELGASLIAITPETPDNSLSTKEKNELTFEVLNDVDNILAKKLGLVFQLPENLVGIYDKFGVDLKKQHGSANNELPMPATFVLDKNGKVVFAFVNEDYTKRAEIADILDALKKLN